MLGYTEAHAQITHSEEVHLPLTTVEDVEVLGYALHVLLLLAEAVRVYDLVAIEAIERIATVVREVRLALPLYVEALST